MHFEIKLLWDELTEEEKKQAYLAYAAIRSVEEEEPCDHERAINETPLCRGFYKDPITGYIHVDI